MDIRAVPFADVGGFSDLFVDYCTQFDSLAAFYAADPWIESNWDEGAQALAADSSYPRERLADILAAQNQKWTDDPEVGKSIERLRTSNSVTVFTGQQVGLFGGPLFALYKTVTTIQRARETALRTGLPVVPVFWMADEDHDFAEVATARSPGQSVSYPRPEYEGEPGSVGDITFDAEIANLVDQALVGIDSDYVSAALKDSYREGRTMSSAFAVLWHRLFRGTGLLVFTPNDPAFKELTKPVFEKELNDPEASREALETATEALKARHPGQIQPGNTNLFLMDERGRRKIHFEDGGFSIGQSGEPVERTDLLKTVDSNPQKLSPNVALRPVIQDFAFPNLAYIAGPGELAYFAQLKGLYEWAGVRMPMILPRASLTLIDSRSGRILKKQDLNLFDLAERPDMLLQRLVIERSDNKIGQAFNEARDRVNALVDGLRQLTDPGNKSLAKSTEASRTNLVNRLARMERRYLAAAKHGQSELKEGIDWASTMVRPSGNLQERVYTALRFIDLAGPDFVQQLLEHVKSDTSQHQIVQQ